MAKHRSDSVFGIDLDVSSSTSNNLVHSRTRVQISSFWFLFPPHTPLGKMVIK